MDTTKQQVLIIALLEAMKQRKSWCGETHLQKCAYFLQDGLGVPLDFEFILYKHGPFSFDLRDLLGDMEARLLINLVPQDPFGPSLIPSPSSEALIKGFPRTIQDSSLQINFVADKLAARSVARLERVSTALWISRHNPGLHATDRARLLTEVKPHIPHDLARVAVDEVDMLLAEADALESPACR